MSARRARKKLFCWKNEECEAGDMKKVSNELPMSISESDRYMTVSNEEG